MAGLRILIQTRDSQQILLLVVGDFNPFMTEVVII